MGLELELSILLFIQTVFISAFAKFEIETPLIKKLSKWFIIDGIAVGLFYFVGHWTILFPVLALVPGTIYHFTWCKKKRNRSLKCIATEKILCSERLAMA